MKKGCQSKGCRKQAVMTSVIHHHTADEKCYPYDMFMHTFIRLCKEHNSHLIATKFSDYERVERQGSRTQNKRVV
jgi:hypothetical protein